ncbi:MAG: hypothetical protein AAF215_25595 [Cyanobacteria bacterium P01_A01_bin.123]
MTSVPVPERVVVRVAALAVVRVAVRVVVLTSPLSGQQYDEASPPLHRLVHSRL